MLHLDHVISRNQAIELDVLSDNGVSLHIKREDEIHPEISGNKWRKLKYHIEIALQKRFKGILTFGGAFSNHIAATAAAADLSGLKSIGIIRGERVEPLNPTLTLATRHGMELHFASRAEYRIAKNDMATGIDPNRRYHHIPEGGADEVGVRGCEEILSERDKTEFDIVCCSSGTGATAAGLYRSLGPNQKLRVYPALKGDFTQSDIEKLLQIKTDDNKLQVTNEFHFGGYAKTNSELFEFMAAFYRQTDILTDPIYTSKMIYGLIEDVKEGRIVKGSRVLAIHTGGLQGISGIELREGIRIFAK